MHIWKTTPQLREAFSVIQWIHNPIFRVLPMCSILFISFTFQWIWIPQWANSYTVISDRSSFIQPSNNPETAGYKFNLGKLFWDSSLASPHNKTQRTNTHLVISPIAKELLSLLVYPGFSQWIVSCHPPCLPVCPFPSPTVDLGVTLLLTLKASSVFIE